MDARNRWFSTAAILPFCVSMALAQAGESPGEFFPFCQPWDICYFGPLFADYPRVQKISVVQGSATLSTAPRGLINESISGAQATLQIVGGAIGTDEFALTVTTSSLHPWTAFEIELQ